VPTLRIPLASPLDSRDSGITKDSISYNVYVEAESPEVFYVVKRPGFKNESTRTGTAQGIFAYGTKVYIWDSNVTATTPDNILISALT
jgi:hypothetical protein